MTNKELAAFVQSKLGQPYLYGALGQIVTVSLIHRLAVMYPRTYTTSYLAKAWKLSGKQAFDCVGLIKFFAWGNTGDTLTVYDGDTDISADGAYSKATVKGPIHTMPDVPGVCVRFSGHIGVYVGDGKVVEARGIDYGVVETELSQRPWAHWLQYPGIDYESGDDDVNITEAIIPWSRIKEICVYESGGAMTLAQVKAKTGAHLIMNGMLYNLSDLKTVANEYWRGGKLVSTGKYPGYAIENQTVKWCEHNDAGAPTFIGMYPSLVQGGAALPIPSGLGIDQEVSRGRTLMGRVPRGLYLACVPDVSGTGDWALAEAQRHLLLRAALDGGNLDGGGSTQCDFGGNRKITSGRKVPTWIYVKLDLPATIRSGDRGQNVKDLQNKLIQQGHKLPKYGADGDFGSETKAAVLAFQRKWGLAADGIAGPNTWTVLETAV
jgi:hypothetical protein